MTNRLVKLSVAPTLRLDIQRTEALVVENEMIKLDTLIICTQSIVNKYGGDIEIGINHLVSSKVSNNTDVHKNCNAIGVDYVIIYRSYVGNSVYGLVYQNNYLNDSNTTWIVKYIYLYIDCGGYITLCEIGHYTGLGYFEVEDSIRVHKYARRHGAEQNITTVIVYSGDDKGSKIYKYSTLIVECNTLPCGIEEGKDKVVDAVNMLLKTIPFAVSLEYIWNFLIIIRIIITRIAMVLLMMA